MTKYAATLPVNQIGSITKIKQVQMGLKGNNPYVAVEIDGERIGKYITDGGEHFACRIAGQTIIFRRLTSREFADLSGLWVSDFPENDYGETVLVLPR